MSNLDILKNLEQQVKMAISLVESGNLATLSEKEIEEHVAGRGKPYDFVIGDFAVHVLTPYDRVWPVRETQPNAT